VTSAGYGQAAVNELEAEFADEITSRDIDKISVLPPVAIVTVVGIGMRGQRGICGSVFSALTPVNIIAIAQGSSECSISLVVSQEEAIKAVQLLHDLIISDYS